MGLAGLAAIVGGDKVGPDPVLLEEEEDAGGGSQSEYGKAVQNDGASEGDVAEVFWYGGRGSLKSGETT